MGGSIETIFNPVAVVEIAIDREPLAKDASRWDALDCLTVYDDRPPNKQPLHITVISL